MQRGDLVVYEWPGVAPATGLVLWTRGLRLRILWSSTAGVQEFRIHDPGGWRVLRGAR